MSYSFKVEVVISKNSTSDQDVAFQLIYNRSRSTLQDKYNITFLFTNLYFSSQTYALLDEGSTVTLCEGSVAEQLGCHGKPKNLEIMRLNGAATQSKKSKEISFKISGYKGAKSLF